ncbi:MAG: hypothetical protein E7465_01095 [Ruminococcaceae bacterium]|nr:hypothetical protein [Oscillospiraceae bacterium]
MAKFTRTVTGDFDRILKIIEKGVLDASTSATLEDGWDVREGDARCAVRVFERYSYAGGNRVSMNVTLFQAGNAVRICAITSGGSQAMFFKVNTWGEETFLDTLKDVLARI